MTDLFVALLAAFAVWTGWRVFRVDSMVRASFSLMLSFVAVGGIGVLLSAPYIGVATVFMMAVEMMVMAIFMVMFMMDPGGMGKMDMTHQKRLSLWAGGIGLVAALVVIWTAGWQGPVPDVPGADEQARLLGREILGRSMFIFESAALMILTAMIAATMVAIAPQEEDTP